MPDGVAESTVLARALLRPIPLGRRLGQWQSSDPSMGGLGRVKAGHRERGGNGVERAITSGADCMKKNQGATLRSTVVDRGTDGTATAESVVPQG